MSVHNIGNAEPLARGGLLFRLWEGFKEARQGLHTVSNPEPCQALLIACAETYQMAPALAVLAEIKQAGGSLSAEIYGLLL